MFALLVTLEIMKKLVHEVWFLKQSTLNIHSVKLGKKRQKIAVCRLEYFWKIPSFGKYAFNL